MGITYFHFQISEPTASSGTEKINTNWNEINVFLSLFF